MTSKIVFQSVTGESHPQAFILDGQHQCHLLRERKVVERMYKV